MPIPNCAYDRSKNVAHPSDLGGEIDALAAGLSTKIWDMHREAVGRGPTPEASQEAAERQWVLKLNASTTPAETASALRAEILSRQSDRPIA
jgi:hypothetical protein